MDKFYVAYFSFSLKKKVLNFTRDNIPKNNHFNNNSIYLKTKEGSI